MRVLLIALFFLQFTYLQSQEVSFDLEVSYDTVYVGNALSVRYIMKNMSGDFQPPSFQGFRVIGGPNVSNHFSMMNGVTNQQMSYQFMLMPDDIGDIQLDPARLVSDQINTESPSINIVVMPNPNGIVQNHKTHSIKISASGDSISVEGGKQDSIRMKAMKMKTRKI